MHELLLYSYPVFLILSMLCNVIIFGSVDWTEHWQMHHQLVMSLSQDGHKVLYVDNTGVRPPSFSKDRTRISRKIKEIFSSTYGFRVVHDNITILSPLLVPHPYNKLALAVNVLALGQRIQNWLSNIGSTHAPVIVVTFLPTPLVYRLCLKIAPNLLVYYCANDMAGNDISKAPLIPWEQAFFRESDQVFTISAELTKRASRFGANVCEFPPGLDDKFLRADLHLLHEPKDLATISHPRITYVGALASASGVFDLDLFLEVVQQNKDFNFILVGPVYGDISSLVAENNVFALGPKSHDAIASYLAHTDVALIPYRINHFTNSVNACKLNEYLFFGCPVVSTPFVEASRIDAVYPGLIHLARSPKAFSHAVRKALSEVGNHSLSDKRKEYAVSTRWSVKYLKIKELLSLQLERSLLALNPAFPSSTDFIFRLRRRRRSLMVAAVSCLSLYWVIFVSPFFPLLGYALSPRDPLGEPEVLLVLTGDGAGSYYNESFLNRAQDVLRVYSVRPGIRVVVSTARQRMISDVSVMKAYLIDRGISPEKISVFTPNAGSTWQHIESIHAALPPRFSGSLALLSSPMHARRSAAMLRKMSPRASFVSAPAVIDTPSTPWRWFPSWTEICVTTYELAAYAYALLRGRV
jgi:glycosyltransferase involved in cell wall biosynthesis/uncharacterized SAM-binding protein YcdF (DUF218 family)